MPGNAHTDVKNHLFGAVDKNAVQYEVGPEQRPLTLDVFKQLQLCRLVIQTVWILETRRRKSRIIRTMSAWTTGVLKLYDKENIKCLLHMWTKWDKWQHLPFYEPFYLFRRFVSVSEKPAASVSTLSRHRQEVSEDYFRKCKDAWGVKRAKQVTFGHREFN